jgi:hypothetical protein
MRRGVHQSRCGVKFAQRFLQADGSTVLRDDRFSGEGKRRKDKQRYEEARSREVGSDSEREVDSVPPDVDGLGIPQGLKSSRNDRKTQFDRRA